MGKIWIIARRDFKSYFTSPIAYIVLTAFLLIMGWMFYNNMVMFFMSTMQYRQYNMGKGPTLSEGVVRHVFGNMNVILLMLVPLITMRLFAEEKKMHTIELLMTAPATLAQIVLAKFTSASCLVGLMLLMTLSFPIVLFSVGEPEIGPIFTCYLGTFLLTACSLSLGVLFSSMTENQIIAAALTYMGSLFFWLIGWASQSAGPVIGEILNYLSWISHFNNFSMGILDTSDVCYYLSFIGVGLFLTHRVLDSFRWR